MKFNTFDKIDCIENKKYYKTKRITGGVAQLVRAQDS